MRKSRALGLQRPSNEHGSARCLSISKMYPTSRIWGRFSHFFAFLARTRVTGLVPVWITPHRSAGQDEVHQASNVRR